MLTIIMRHLAVGLLSLLLFLGCGGGSDSLTAPNLPPSPTDFTPALSRLAQQALIDDLRTLSAPEMGGRKMGSAGNEAARALLVQRFTTLGLTMFGTSFRHPFTSIHGSGTNVVGCLQGTTYPDEYLLLTAHFDHIGSKGGQVVCGADDNASGTAAVLRLADYLKSHPPARSVVFCLFDGEEAGLLGSEAFASAPPAPLTLAKIKVVLNLDMIAQGTQGRIFVGGTSYTTPLKPYLLNGFASSKVKVVPDFETYDAYSDQSPFMDRGVPFLFFCVGDDDPYYHTVNDTFDRIPQVFYWAAVEAILETFLRLDTPTTLPEMQAPARFQIPFSATRNPHPWAFKRLNN